MTPPPRAAALVQTFNTHLMADDAITALRTARVRETREVMDAVRRNLHVVPGPLQQVAIYGPRGFGKSFMTRLLQIEVEKLATTERRIAFVLLPEEQHNLARNPHGLLEYLTAKLRDQRLGNNSSWQEAAFRWPKPDEQGTLWRQAVRKLDEELDQQFAGARGLAIAVVENFDILLATVFKEHSDEERLRQWLGRDDNRVMLLATATGTADLDYERPLFQALQSVRLDPWTPDDCIAYFNRRRAALHKPPLDAETEPKARAIADFIGGNPRLAQLLDDVLETEDALGVAETMNALADRLADYYRRRIEDLPQLAQGLLDALIRGGEPCSATVLAERVGAGQSDIARTMQDLQRADIVRGTPALDGREKLFRVIDRVFAHYYRLRQGDEAVRASPLLTILDFLRSFYSREEQREQAARYLDQSRPAEAAVFSRLANEGDAPAGSTWFNRGFAARLRIYAAAAPDSLALPVSEIVRLLERNAAQVIQYCLTDAAPAPPLHAAVLAVLRAQVQARMGLSREAEATLRKAKAQAEADGDPSATVVAARELSDFLLYERGTGADAEAVSAVAAAQAEAALAPGLRALALLEGAWTLGQARRHDAAIVAATQAAALFADAGEAGGQARATRHKAWNLGQLGRYDEAVVAADTAARLAEAAGDVGEQSFALRNKASSLVQLQRYDEAIAAAAQATELAAQAGDIAEQAQAARLEAFSLHAIDRSEEAWSRIALALGLTQRAGDRLSTDAAADVATMIAGRVPRPQALGIFASWLDRHLATPLAAAPDPAGAINSLLAAVARAGAWRAFDELFARHEAWFAGHWDDAAAWEIGGALAEVFGADGRAAAFAAAFEALARVRRLAALTNGAAASGQWLTAIVARFARKCGDSGMLHDFAELIEDAMAPNAAQQRTLLLQLAAFAASPRSEAALARMDPDVATWVRQIRSVPDPPPSRPAKHRKRGKSRA